MSRDVVVLDDAAEVADRVATAFLDRIEAEQATGAHPHVVLTGGTVARLVHRRIAELAPQRSVDWNRIDFWWGDDRFVPAGDPDRNDAQAAEDFLDAVGAANRHPMPAAGVGLEDAVAQFATELAANAPDVFDLVMLGMGPDGHVASLFPGKPTLSVDEADAVAEPDSPKPPAERISMTLPRLNRARATWFLVTGAEKKEATQRAWAFDGSIEETPARGISGPSVTWFVDRTIDHQPPLTRR